MDIKSKQKKKHHSRPQQGSSELIESSGSRQNPKTFPESLTDSVENYTLGGDELNVQICV